MSIFFGLIICIILSSACSSPPPSSSPVKEEGKREGVQKGDIATGVRIYGKHCHYCHGTEGRGDGAIAIGLSPRPVNFAGDIERMKKSDEELFESIAKGIRRKDGGEEMAMPRWDLILTEDEIWSVLAYVRHLSEK